MTIEVCSKCNEPFLKCSCENFHPPIELVDGPNHLIISKEEAEGLLSYFIERAGFISFEFDEKVHKFIDRLNEFVRNKP